MKLYKITAGKYTYYVATDDPKKIYDHNFDYNPIVAVELIDDVLVLK